MTFTAKTANGWRAKSGPHSNQLADEFKKVETEFQANIKVAKGVLSPGSANAFAFAWQNPESSKILITKFVANKSAAGGTATSVLDVGSGATATTHNDNLIDGADLNSTGILDNITNKGTDGLPQIILDEKGGTTSFITGQILTAAAASLAGKYYIFYILI